MCNPEQEIRNFGKGLERLGGEFTKTLERIAENPLPIITTAALTWVLGPAGAGLSTGTAATVASAATSALNGGSIEQIVLSAATAYVGGQIGKELGNAAGEIITSTGLSPETQNLLKSIVTSASGSASVTALQGRPLNEVLASATSAAVGSLVKNELVNQGVNPKSITSDVISNTTNAVTRAILNGTSISQAFANSAVSTFISSAVSAAVSSSIKQNVEDAGQSTGGSGPASFKDLSSEVAEAKQDVDGAYKDYLNNYNEQKSLIDNFNKKIKPLQDLGAQVQKYRTDYDRVVEQYNNPPPSATPQQIQSLVAYANSVAKLINQEVKNYESQYNRLLGDNGVLLSDKQKIESLKAAENQLENNLKTKQENFNSIIGLFTQAEINNSNIIDKKINEYVTAGKQYKDEFGVDPTEDQLKSFGANGDVIGSVSKIVADNNNEQAAVAAGYKNYADFTAAGNISPNDFYAKQQGWQDYAQQLSAQNNGYNNPNEWNTHINNQQTAVDNGFTNYQDYQAAAGTTSNDFYAKKEGWTNYAEKSQATDAGFKNPTTWNTHVTDVKNQESAKAAGFPDYATQQQYGGDINSYKSAQNEIVAKNASFPDFETYKKYNGDLGLYQSAINEESAKAAGFPNYATQQEYKGDFDAYKTVQNDAAAKAAGFPDYDTQIRFGNNVDDYKAVQEGWTSLFEKESAAKYEITSPNKYQEFLSGKTEEDKVVQILRDRGVPATPERVAAIMDKWDFNPTTPNVGFGDAFNQSDKLNISNSRADSVQEAAALAKSLGYSNFAFGGTEYKINPQATATNPYDFFSSFGEAYKAARSDLGAGKNFEWKNPVTGETKTFSTNNEKEQAVADQKRIDLMPAYTGEGAYTRNGNPGIVDNIFYDKNSNNVVQDNRVWDQDGKLVSGEVKNINPDASGTAAERVAASLKESFGKTFDAFKYVTSGINKGGWELLNQVGVLGGLTGLVDMDNWATKTSADMKKVIDGYQNKEFLNNRSLMNSAIAKAGNEGIFAQAVEAGKQFGLNPLQTAEFIAQQGASLFLGGGAMATARALGAGLTAQQAATIGTMAVAQGASVADQAYRDGLKNNKTPEEALNAARVAWAGSALTSAIANKFIPGALSNEAAIASQNIAKASLSTALRGEMSSELAENTSGQIIANFAAGNPWDKDLGSTIIQSIVASGAITGLVNVSTTGNPETAIAIAKDAGVTDKQINDIKNAFKASLGTENYNPAAAKQQLDSVLSASNLNPEIADQLGDLIGVSAIKDAVSPTLQKAGVPEAYVDSLANLTATQIYNNEDLPSTFNNLSSAFQAYGFDPLQANLITNETLTGTDVKQVVTDQLKAAGYNPTQAEVNNLISQNASANPVDIGESVSSYVEPRLITKEEASEALVSAGISNPSEEQINTLVGQYDQNLLQSRADTTAGDISTQLSSAEKASFERDAALSKTLNDISAQMTANQNSGMNADQALSNAIEKVATDAGTTKQELLGQIGTTEQGLKNDIASLQQKTTQDIAGVQTQIGNVQESLTKAISDARAAGLQGDQALQSGIDSVAANLGVTKDALLAQVGKSEEQLRSEMQTGQQQTAQSIANLDASTKAKFDALTQEQQSQALALANSTKDLQGSIDTVAQQTTQQITNVQTTLQNQLAQQNTQTQQAFASMNAAQQKEVADRVAQGEGLTKAIGDVSGQVTGLGGQVTALQTELAAQKAAEEAYRKEQEEKAAQDAAKAAQSAARAAASSRMSTQAGVLSGLAGLAGAAAVSDEEFKPLQGTFLTSKGGQSGYKGLLQDFQQEVEGQPNMADNRMGRQESNDMAPYYSYGNETSLGQILGQENDQQQFFASGGLATPLMAAGGAAGTRYGKYAAGGMPSPLMAAGGKMRVDFRKGDAVTGPGDGQSDDIPAMLADGEFVFPADVVAALGNGSTKAGSDKLYDMMHSIRAHVRSAKPKDLPPEIKSPLDFLKTSKKSSKKRRA